MMTPATVLERLNRRGGNEATASAIENVGRAARIGSATRQWIGPARTVATWMRERFQGLRQPDPVEDTAATIAVYHVFR